MPQLRQYPQVFSLLPTDALILDRLGAGTAFVDANVVGPQSLLISSSGIVLQVGNFYGVKTSLGAFTLTLPALSSVTPPLYLDVADIDYNAHTNNITIAAAGSDLISDHGVTHSTYSLKISNTTTRFVANTSSWTALTYGT